MLLAHQAEEHTSPPELTLSERARATAATRAEARAKEASTSTPATTALRPSRAALRPETCAAGTDDERAAEMQAVVLAAVRH